MLLKILSVAALATFEIYAAIPSGFAMGLPAWIILLASIAGGVTGVFVTAFFGDRIRGFFQRKKQPHESPETKHPMLSRIWKKYGIIGLGFLGTITVGAPITIATGVALNANLKKLVSWSVAGVVTRCILFTLIGYYGLKLF